MSCFIWFLRRLNQLYSLPLQRSVRQHCILLCLNGCDAVALKGQYWWTRFDISRWISSRPSWRYPVHYLTQSQLNPEESFQSLPGNFSLLVWDIHLTLQPIMQKKEKKCFSFGIVCQLLLSPLCWFLNWQPHYCSGKLYFTNFTSCSLSHYSYAT